MLVYAVVPTYNRQELLERCLDSLDVPLDQIAVVNNGDEVRCPQGVTVLDHPERPPNIQRMWNLGLDWAAREARGRNHGVLLVNDDVEALSGLALTLAHFLVLSGADIAYPSQGGTGHLPWVLRKDTLLPKGRPETPDKAHRMTGWCFMVRGDSAMGGPGLRADERFVWHYGDNDLEWRAQQAGGTVEVPGIEVVHHCPGQQTAASEELRAQVRRDRARFRVKWGRNAW